MKMETKVKIWFRIESFGKSLSTRNVSSHSEAELIESVHLIRNERKRPKKVRLNNIPSLWTAD